MQKEVSKLAVEVGEAMVELLEQRMPPAFRRVYEVENGAELSCARARLADIEARVAELERGHADVRALDGAQK